MALLPPVKADFGTDGNKDLDVFVQENLGALIAAYKTLHTTKIGEWRRLTKGQPKEKTRSFPWDNASNVVIQLIGENVETLKAVQLGTIYEIMPIWTAGLVGDFTDEEKGESQRSVSERFLDLMALSKNELDLYRVESKAAFEIAAYGSVLVKFPWTTIKEQVVIGMESPGNFKEDELTIYDGPRPEKVAYEDWAATPTAQTWEDASFKYHEIRLTKQQCEKKVFEGAFSKDNWEKLEKSPDLEGFTEEESKKMQEQNIQDSANKYLARWRFYECWFKWRRDNKTYSIIFIAHRGPDLRMGAVFNFYPKNEEPFEFGRLGFSEDGLIGYGFAEMGEMYQEDVSTKHNQRADNHTLQNAPVVLGGTNPRIDSGIAIFPMAVLPFSPDEVEIKQLGVVDSSSVEEEQMTIALAKARFGTDMLSAEGNGSGSTTKKGGYSSMGTFSIMQQGARRINVNVTDFRYLHLNIGQKAFRQYAWFGIGDDRYKYWGNDAKYLRMALENIKSGRLELPIKAATASINKEVEKQTGMLFTQVMQRHYGAITQMLQGASNPVVASTMPELPEFLMGSIGGMAYIMSRLLRGFGYDDISRAQPELLLLEKMRARMKAQQQKEQQGANNGNNKGTTGGNAGAPQNGNGTPDVQEASGPQGVDNNSSSAASAEASGGILLH